MSFTFNIRSRSLILTKLGLVVGTTMILASCVSSSTTNSLGTKLLAVSPSAFNCPANPTLELRIHQDANDDADRIDCINPAANCTALLPASARARTPDIVTVYRRDTVRWKLSNPAATDEFYIIFDGDRSPAHRNNDRGSSIVGSEGGELCLKVNRGAKASTTGVRYDYSVFVKHCAGTVNCTPKVLDPIIYVRW